MEIVRALYEALDRVDFEAAEAQLGPDVAWDTNARGSDGTVVPPIMHAPSRRGPRRTR